MNAPKLKMNLGEIFDLAITKDSDDILKEVKTKMEDLIIDRYYENKLKEEETKIPEEDAGS